MIKTEDGGATWVSVSSGLPSTVTSTSFFYHAIAVGKATLFFCPLLHMQLHKWPFSFNK